MSGLRLSEGATVIGGDGGAGLVPDASTRHAHVLRVDDDGDILRVELELQRLADLAREPLLHLRPPPKVVTHPVELREPYHPPRGKVGDVRLADDGQEVVLTRRVERDVPLDEHLAVLVDVVEGAAHGPVRRVEPAEDLLHVHLRDPVRRARKTVVLSVETKDIHDLLGSRVHAWGGTRRRAVKAARATQCAVG